MDQSKKTMRHFYCRDVLWETFEQMANDFDCSIDYLINEAMRYYARSKNYQAAQQSGAVPTGAQPPAMAAPSAAPGGGTPGLGAPAMRRPPPPTPGPRIPTPAAPPNASLGDMSPPSSPSGRRPAVPPAPPPTPAPVAGQQAPTLYLIFNNQRIAIDKDQFIIGRGSKTSDLAIKDGNISRKHAAVIRRNGTYYVKDLGSTNGIDYKGMRIDNKRIDEGDVFHLCDYELRFTYR